jgi:hypothetical protein
VSIAFFPEFAERSSKLSFSELNPSYEPLWVFGRAVPIYIYLCEVILIILEPIPVTIPLVLNLAVRCEWLHRT